MDATVPLLAVCDLRVSFRIGSSVTPVVDGVSLRVPCGKVVALVGESGCGKSVTALSIMRLVPQPPGHIDGGQVLLADRPPQNTRALPACHAPTEGAGMSDSSPQGCDGDTLNEITPVSAEDAPSVDLLQLTERQMQRIRGARVAMIFQEPMPSLNPVYTVGWQIVEAIQLHQSLRGKVAWAQAVELLRKVGVSAPEKRVHDYPHQLSGGMQQRVMIAMALACRPALLIADEPTTALDVTIQRQILELLRRLQAETGMSLLLITHDLDVVAEIADDVYVMYAGRIVEHAPARELLDHPLHPYTQGLLRCTPRLGKRKDRLDVIPGQVPDPSHWPTGCRFHPRCRLCVERAGRGGRPVVSIDSPIGAVALRRCVESYDAEPSGRPELREVRPGHEVACWEVSRPS